MNLEPHQEFKVTRRLFLKGAIGLISGWITVMLGWPFISYLVRPFYKVQKSPYVEVPGYEALSPGIPAKLNFQMVYKDAFQTSNIWQDVWVIKHSPKEATVFSPICTHLGCRYDWESQVKEFVCPCHGSVFSPAGKVLAGPAPRPLDTLPYKIEGTKLYVEWERFKPGIPEKVEI